MRTGRPKVALILTRVNSIAASTDLPEIRVLKKAFKSQASKTVGRAMRHYAGQVQRFASELSPRTFWNFAREFSSFRRQGRLGKATLISDTAPPVSSGDHAILSLPITPSEL
jgi:hypothetical protein